MLLLSQNLHNFFSHLDVITDQPQETGKKYSAELGVTVTHYENMVGAAGDADEGFSMILAGRVRLFGRFRQVIFMGC